MSLQTINVSVVANDGLGDPLRTALQKVNSNFAAGLSVNRVPVTSPELLGLHTVPIVLAAAPGVGKIIVPVYPIYQVIFGTVAYDNLNTPGLYYGDSAGPAADGANQPVDVDIFQSAASNMGWTNAPSGTVTGHSAIKSPAAIANQPIVFSDVNDWISGDGEAVIWLVYLTITL